MEVVVRSEPDLLGPPSDFKAELDKYFNENSSLPSLTQWMATKLTEEQQHWYDLLMNSRLTTNAKFPVHFDPLWHNLGYTLKENAKRILTSYKLDIEYICVCQTEEHSRGGHNKEEIYLTLNAAQKFALQSRGKYASSIADFFIKTVESVQAYHILTLMYQQKEASSEVRAQALLTVADKKPVTYLGDIGVINGKHMVKHGFTDNLCARNSSHKRTFEEFNLIAVFETTNNREVEKRFKMHRIFADNQENIIAKDGSVQTECFVWKDDMCVSKILKVWKTIDDELNTQQQQLWQHEETMARIQLETHRIDAEARIAEAETRKAEIQLRMMELQNQHSHVALPMDVDTDTNEDTQSQSVFLPEVYQRYLDEMCHSSPGVKCYLKDLLGSFVSWTKENAITPTINILCGSSKTYGYTNDFFAEFVRCISDRLGALKYVQKQPKLRGWYGNAINV